MHETAKCLRLRYREGAVTASLEGSLQGSLKGSVTGSLEGAVTAVGEDAGRAALAVQRIGHGAGQSARLSAPHWGANRSVAELPDASSGRRPP